ncbi:MAG: hypothetical protein ABGX24_03855 [Aquificota bacterium]|jgi:hypothetical protein
MFYWLIVIIVWIGSLALIGLGSISLFLLFNKGNVLSNEGYIAMGMLALGILLNFLVVNWPVEPVRSQELSEEVVKALKIMAKVAPIAPKAVQKGIKEILKKYGYR